MKTETSSEQSTSHGGRNFNAAGGQPASERYILKLYVAGHTERSIQAIAVLRSICEEYLQGSFDLEVIDVYQNPPLAEREDIIVTPTLVKQLPLPLHKVVGDLSSQEKVLVGLNITKID